MKKSYDVKDMFEENETRSKLRVKSNSHKFAICKAGSFAKAISHKFRKVTKENGDG
jgi:hypothetical protein